MSEVRVPGDKSLSHRALILAALADGRSRIRSILQSDDIASTAAVLRGYGINIPALSSETVVDGVGLRGLSPPTGDLDCGNSGTTARLMTGIAAALPFSSRFVGDASLSRRPMRRLARILEQMGAAFEFEDADGLPMVVHGGELAGIEFTNEQASAQVKSALLLAGLISRATVTVIEPRRSRDHTEIMLEALGAHILREGARVTIAATDRIAPLDFDVPADPSSAAFLAALASLLPTRPVSLTNVCLNPTRLGFFSALERMGASVQLRPAAARSAGEPVGEILVSGRQLRGVTIDRESVPALVDELPLIACIATRAQGETRVQGAEELRLKESDRIAAIVHNLRSIGASVEELRDGFVVQGSEKPLGGMITTRGDHRIAMAFGVLGEVPGNRIEIDDPGCVSVSYPGFWQQLHGLRAR